MSLEIPLDKYPTWRMQFPGNLRWSNAFQIQKGMAPYGAVALGEIDMIAQRLRARQNEPDRDQTWLEEWERMADRLEREADAAAAKGHNFTAGNLYIRAGNYHFAAERFLEGLRQGWIKQPRDAEFTRHVMIRDRPNPFGWPHPL